MVSHVADIKRAGGRSGESCTAAIFLQEFVEEGRSWAQVDIAGVLESKGDICPARIGHDRSTKLNPP
jgi:leucyl aminopeptidase